MNNLTKLKQICPPPTSPAPAPVEDWESIEQRLGIKLPEDYKQLVEEYGLGSFNDFIYLYQPNARLDTIDIEKMSKVVRTALKESRMRGRYPVPYDPDLLQLAGVTDNGEYLFWVVEPEASPSSWKIAVNEARGDRWFMFDGDLTSFLLNVITGRTIVPMFPNDFVDDSPTFEPYGT